MEMEECLVAALGSLESSAAALASSGSFGISSVALKDQMLDDP